MQLFDKWLAEIEAEIKDYKQRYPFQCYPWWLMRRRAQLRRLQELLSHRIR